MDLYGMLFDLWYWEVIAWRPRHSIDTIVANAQSFDFVNCLVVEKSVHHIGSLCSTICLQGHIECVVEYLQWGIITSFDFGCF